MCWPGSGGKLLFVICRRVFYFTLRVNVRLQSSPALNCARKKKDKSIWNIWDTLKKAEILKSWHHSPFLDFCLNIKGTLSFFREGYIRREANSKLVSSGVSRVTVLMRFLCENSIIPFTRLINLNGTRWRSWKPGSLCDIFKPLTYFIVYFRVEHDKLLLRFFDFGVLSRPSHV